MITFFAIVRPFMGEFDQIQRTAMVSWASAVDDAQIIIFGDVDGAAGACAEVGANHVPDVAVNEWGTELVSDAWIQADDMARHDWICALNSDNVVSTEIMQAVENLKDVERPFVVGQRWDLEPGETEVELHPPHAMDWFLFRKGTIPVEEIPPFAVGRTAYDNWLIQAALERWNMTVIDATADITIMHLNHGFPEYGNKAKMIASQERQRNIELFHEYGGKRPYGIRRAPYILDDGEVSFRE